jgi:hypothetical protein
VKTLNDLKDTILPLATLAVTKQLSSPVWKVSQTSLHRTDVCLFEHSRDTFLSSRGSLSSQSDGSLFYSIDLLVCLKSEGHCTSHLAWVTSAVLDPLDSAISSALNRLFSALHSAESAIIWRQDFIIINSPHLPSPSHFAQEYQLGRFCSWDTQNFQRLLCSATNFAHSAWARIWYAGNSIVKRSMRLMQWGNTLRWTISSSNVGRAVFATKS